LCQSDVIYYSIHKLIFYILNNKILKFKHLIDNITINFLFSGNFASMENIRRKCNSMVDLSKVTLNKNILSGVIALSYN